MRRTDYDCRVVLKSEKGRKGAKMVRVSVSEYPNPNHNIRFTCFHFFSLPFNCILLIFHSFSLFFAPFRFSVCAACL